MQNRWMDEPAIQSLGIGSFSIHEIGNMLHRMLNWNLNYKRNKGNGMKGHKAYITFKLK